MVSERGRKIAFTLAEVLITLGIIGVVAAITIPTLIQNVAERSNSDHWCAQQGYTSWLINSVSGFWNNTVCTSEYGGGLTAVCIEK